MPDDTPTPRETLTAAAELLDGAGYDSLAASLLKLRDEPSAAEVETLRADAANVARVEAVLRERMCTLDQSLDSHGHLVLLEYNDDSGGYDDVIASAPTIAALGGLLPEVPDA